MNIFKQKKNFYNDPGIAELLKLHCVKPLDFRKFISYSKFHHVDGTAEIELLHDIVFVGFDCPGADI